MHWGEHGEHSNRGNISLRHLAYGWWLQQLVMKLWNHTIYCSCKGWVGADVKFWTFEGEGFSKSYKCKQGGGGSKFWSLCDNIIIECPQPYIYDIHMEGSGLGMRSWILSQNWSFFVDVINGWYSNSNTSTGNEIALNMSN